MSASPTRTVPHSADGIIYQFDRALYWLATCSEEGIVGIETDDDVSVYDPSGASSLEQTKISQQGGHPFQDSSEKLWNTLLIWLQMAKNRSDWTTRAELHLVTNRYVPPTAIAYRLGANRQDSPPDIRRIIDELRTIARATRSKQDLAKIMNDVVAFSDEELTSVLCRIRLSDGTAGTWGEDHRRNVISALHLPPEADKGTILTNLLGWLVHTTCTLWRAGKPGSILRTDFDRQISAAIRTEDRKRRRERARSLVSVTESDRMQARQSKFVERINEVEASEDDLLQAIDDHIRFRSELIRLSQEGDITIPEWEDFYNQLSDRWTYIKLRNQRNRQGLPDEQVGYRILTETAMDSWCGRLCGEQTDHPYFTAGAYHRLADNDRVWWHPSYRPPLDHDEGAGQ